MASKNRPIVFSFLRGAFRAALAFTKTAVSIAMVPLRPLKPTKVDVLSTGLTLTLATAFIGVSLLSDPSIESPQAFLKSLVCSPK